MDQQNLSSLPATGFIRIKQVLNIIPIGRTSWYAGIKKGKFPAGIHLGPRTTAWRVEDIRALIQQFGA